MSRSAKEGSSLRDLVRNEVRRRELEELGLWTADTLPSVVDEHAARAPDRIAVVDLEGTRSMTYGRLVEDSKRVVASLVGLGVGRGDVVTVQMPNWYETVAIDLGILRLGAVLNAVLPSYRAHELSHIFRTADTVLAVAPVEHRTARPASEAKQAAALLDRRIPVVCLGSPFDEPAALELAFGDASYDIPPAPAGPVSQVIFTSGSESAPKGVMHSEQTTTFAVSRAARFLGLDAGVVVWMPSPIGHSTGFNYGVRLALLQGGRVVLQDRWDADVALTLCETQRASCTSVSPTFLKDLLERLVQRPADVSSLRYFTVAGAPIPSAMVAEAAAHGIVVLRGYGSTELLGVSKMHPSDPLSKRTSTEGRPMVDLDVEIRTDDGRVLAAGEEGEIFVRTPGACFGFVGDEERSREIFDEDGWGRTGDLGVLDEDGYLTITGRKKEIIIRGGMNIARRVKIEDLLRLNPAVADVAVIGLPDDRLGEIVCACVVPAGPMPLTLEDLVEYLRAAELAVYKLPQRLRVLDRLPLNAIGKVDKRSLLAETEGGAS